MKIMKTKISHLLALLTMTAAAVLIENAFLQSMTINNQAYDLMAKTTINEISQENLSFLKNADKVDLAEASLPLFPGAQRLTFNQDDSVRYRIDKTANKVASFYNQIMSAAGWTQIKSSAQKPALGENLERVVIVLAENPITKKTEAIFSNKPLSQSDIFGALNASAEEAVVNNAPQEPVQPQPLIPSSGNQINQTAPTNNQTQPLTPQQTCRVNGVEMPGDCSQYNKGSNPQSLEFSRPGGEQGQQQGPSEEDMKKMDERRLKDMKRGLSQFTRSAQMMKKNVAKTKAAIAKCGVNIPEELSNALDSIDGLVKKINDAQSADELDEVVGDIQDVGSVMQDWGPRMGELPRLCQMLKQADRDLKQLDRSLTRYQAKNSAKLDLSEILAEYKTNVDNMRQALSQAKELAKTDPEEALSKIEDDFYGSMDNVRNSEQAINMVLNIGQGIRQASAEIKKIERDIKNLKKKKIDTAQLEELLADFKTQLEDIKSLVKGKFDADELISKVETAFDTLEQIFDARQEYGLGAMEPQIKENKSLNMQVNLPDAFKKQAGNEAGDANQGEILNNPETKQIKP